MQNGGWQFRHTHLQNGGWQLCHSRKMACSSYHTPPDNRLGGAAQRPGPCGSSILLGINRQGWGMASGISQWSLNSCRLLPVGKWRSVGILLAGQMILKSADKQELFSVINSIVYHVTEVGKNG